MRGSPRGLPDLVQGLPGPLLLGRMDAMEFSKTYINVDFPVPVADGTRWLSVLAVIRRQNSVRKVYITVKPIAIYLGLRWPKASESLPKGSLRLGGNVDTISVPAPLFIPWLAALSDEGKSDLPLFDHFLAHFPAAVNHALREFGISV